MARADDPRIGHTPTGRSGNGPVRNVSLDTLRALAIVLVVLAHTASNYGDPSIGFLGIGGVGVDLFFCLSGWLLGRQLCQEFKRTGRIDIYRFWTRRWLRTLPAYYAVLFATVGQLTVAGKATGWWHYLLFIQNYTGMPFFGVSWSLCVEEYFYLTIAPLMLLVCRRRRLIPIAALVFLIPLTIRLTTSSTWAAIGQQTHVRYDQCAVGVLLAVVATFTPRMWGALLRSLPVLLATAFLLAGANLYSRVVGVHHVNWDPLVWSFIFATLIVLANSNQFWRLGARIPGSRFLADRAYALYLLHVDGMAVVSRVLSSSLDTVPYWAYLLAVWLVSLIAAEILYRVIEQPFMRLRERYSISRAAHSLPTPEPLVESVAR